MKPLFKYLIVALLGFPALANADVLSVRQEIITSTDLGNEERIEVTALVAENEGDREKIVEFLVRTLESDQATNPKLLTVFEEVTDGAGRSPSSNNPARSSIEKVAGSSEVIRRPLDTETRKALKANFSSWFRKNYRISFALTRGFINSSVTTWSLMASHVIPFEVALTAGIITGAISGSAQYWNSSLQTYLSKTLSHRYIPSELLRGGVKKIEPFFRWYTLEVGFIAIVQLVMTSLGYAPEGTLGVVVKTNLVTALATVGAQGFWDIAISKSTKSKLQQATSLLARNKIQLRSDLITLGLSALSVSAMIAKLQGLPIANAVFGGMGATGFLYFLKVIHSDWKCKRHLHKQPPSKPDEASSVPLSGYFHPKYKIGAAYAFC